MRAQPQNRQPDSVYFPQRAAPAPDSSRRYSLYFWYLEWPHGDCRLLCSSLLLPCQQKDRKKKKKPRWHQKWESANRSENLARGIQKIKVPFLLYFADVRCWGRIMECGREFQDLGSRRRDGTKRDTCIVGFQIANRAAGQGALGIANRSVFRT